MTAAPVRSRTASRDALDRVASTPRARRLLTIAPYVVLTVVSVWWVAVSVMHHGLDMSIFDEWVYLDYLFKLPQDPVVVRGEAVGPDANHLMSCYGTNPYGVSGAPCGGDYSESGLYPQQGLQSADTYSPLFFWITWVVAAPLRAVFGIEFVEAVRLVGIIWLVPTVLLLHATMVALRVPRWFSLAVALGFIVTPMSWWTFTYVSTDAPGPLILIASLWVVVRRLQGRGSIWWLVPIALFGGLCKVVTVFGPVLAGLVLVVHWWLRRRAVAARASAGPASPDAILRTLPDVGLGRRSSMPRVLIAPVVAVVVLMAATLAWQFVRAVQPDLERPDQGVSIGPSAYSAELLDDVFKFITEAAMGTTVFSGGDAAMVYHVSSLVVWTLTILIVAGVVGGVFVRDPHVVRRSIAVSVTVAAFTAGPALFLLLVATNQPINMPPRYGAALVPAFFVAIGLAVRDRWARYAVAIALVAVVALQLYRAPLLA